MEEIKSVLEEYSAFINNFYIKNKDIRVLTERCYKVFIKALEDVNFRALVTRNPTNYKSLSSSYQKILCTSPHVSDCFRDIFGDSKYDFIKIKSAMTYVYNELDKFCQAMYDLIGFYNGIFCDGSAITSCLKKYNNSLNIKNFYTFKKGLVSCNLTKEHKLIILTLNDLNRYRNDISHSMAPNPNYRLYLVGFYIYKFYIKFFSSSKSQAVQELVRNLANLDEAVSRSRSFVR